MIIRDCFAKKKKKTFAIAISPYLWTPHYNSTLHAIFYYSSSFLKFLNLKNTYIKSGLRSKFKIKSLNKIISKAFPSRHLKFHFSTSKARESSSTFMVKVKFIFLKRFHNIFSNLRIKMDSNSFTASSSRPSNHNFNIFFDF